MDETQRRQVYLGSESENLPKRNSQTSVSAKIRSYTSSDESASKKEEEELWLTWDNGTYRSMSSGQSMAQLGYYTMDEMRGFFDAERMEFGVQEEARAREFKAALAEAAEAAKVIEDTQQTDSISLPVQRQSSKDEAEIQSDKEGKNDEDMEYTWTYPDHLADISAFVEHKYGGKNRYKMNEKARPYTTSLSKLKENHPLMIMINEEQWVILLNYLRYLEIVSSGTCKPVTNYRAQINSKIK